MEAIPEHTTAILTRDVPTKDLQAGDVGRVVSIQYTADGDPAGYTLEIFTFTGQSLGVVNVEAAAVREAGGTDIPHARTRSGSA